MNNARYPGWHHDKKRGGDPATPFNATISMAQLGGTAFLQLSLDQGRDGAIGNEGAVPDVQRIQFAIVDQPIKSGAAYGENFRGLVNRMEHGHLSQSSHHDSGASLEFCHDHRDSIRFCARSGAQP